MYQHNLMKLAAAAAAQDPITQGHGSTPLIEPCCVLYGGMYLKINDVLHIH
jgi:hypothetical protein